MSCIWFVIYWLNFMYLCMCNLINSCFLLFTYRTGHIGADAANVESEDDYGQGLRGWKGDLNDITTLLIALIGFHTMCHYGGPTKPTPLASEPCKFIRIYPSTLDWLLPWALVLDSVGHAKIKGRPKIPTRIRPETETSNQIKRKRSCGYCEEQGYTSTECAKCKFDMQFLERTRVEYLSYNACFIF